MYIVNATIKHYPLPRQLTADDVKSSMHCLLLRAGHGKLIANPAYRES